MDAVRLGNSRAEERVQLAQVGTPVKIQTIHDGHSGVVI